MVKRRLLGIIILFLISGCTLKEHWIVSEPEEEGMDSKVFKQITDNIEEEFPDITSVLIIKNGSIVFEEYYKGDMDTQRHISNDWYSHQSGGYKKSRSKGARFFPGI